MAVLAIDYGSKNVGLALVPSGTQTAVPLSAIPNAGKWHLKDDLGHIIRDKLVDTIVVGMPVSLSGGLGPQAAEVSEFVRFLRDETDWDIHIADERLTTCEASRYAVDAGVDVDSAAAVLIAEIFLAGGGTD